MHVKLMSVPIAVKSFILCANAAELYFLSTIIRCLLIILSDIFMLFKEISH